MDEQLTTSKTNIWYTEYHTNSTGITFRVKNILHREETEYQELVIMDTFDYGKVMLLDGLVMLTDRDEFVYHEMITHVPLLAQGNPKRGLIVGGGDGGSYNDPMGGGGDYGGGDYGGGRGGSGGGSGGSSNFDPNNPGVRLEFNIGVALMMGQPATFAAGAFLVTGREDLEPVADSHDVPLETCQETEVVYTPSCSGPQDCASEQQCVPETDMDGNAIANSDTCK